MKSKWIILITAALSTGCMQVPPASTDNASVRLQSTAGMVLKETPAPREDLVVDAFSEKTDHYEIHIPKLVRNGEGAADFNALLLDNYAPVAAYAQEMDVSDYLLIWESYVYDNILSILMTLEDGESAPYHKFYYYDLNADEQLYQEDVLNQMGLDAYEIRNEAARAAAEAFDQNMLFEPLFNTQSTAEYLAERQASIAQAFDQSIDSRQFYPEADGLLQMYLSIYHPAADMWLDVLCTVDLAREEMPLSADYEFMHVTFEPSLHELYLRYEDNSDDPHAQFYSDAYRDLYGFSYDMPIQIQGCFSHYIDAQIVNAGYGAGNELYPILFLLTDHNTVEYVDLFLGALYGYYFNQGPVVGMTDIHAIEEGKGEYGAKTMYGITSDHEKIDLMEHLYAGGISPSLRHIWQMEDQNQKWTLIFDNNVQCAAEYWNGSEIQRFEGTASRIGTNEHGVVYAVDYEKENVTSLYVINVLENMILIRELEGSESVFDWEPQEEHDLYLMKAEG